MENQWITKMCASAIIISQIMLEMLCTSTQECHYVVWTPTDTKVFPVKRGDSYIELLLKYRPLQILESCFALDEVQPAWHEYVFGL